MRKFLFAIFAMVLPLMAVGQSVTDVEVSQEGKCVVVSYSIDKSSPEVTLHVSTDGGKTFSGALKAVSGDVKDVSAGRRSIRWDVLAEREMLVGDNILFRVIPKANRLPNGHKFVDLGLSVVWATCNVGAYKPEDRGGYYLWAGIKNVSDRRIYLDWDNCPYHTGSVYWTGWTKYVLSHWSCGWTDTGIPDDKLVLDPEDDVALKEWGGSWRMPTAAEWDELLDKDNCSWTWTSINGIKGYKVQSKKPGFTANWIFLPAAGYRNYDYLNDLGSIGSYWSSSIDPGYPHFAYCVDFASDYVNEYGDYRRGGRSIRPVMK